MTQDEMTVTWGNVAKRLYLFIPVVVLIYQILAGRALSSATLESIVLIIVLAILSSSVGAFRRHGAAGAISAAKGVLVDSVRALDNGARGAVAVAIPCAGAGIVVGVASMTNLGLTFGSFVALLSGECCCPRY